MLLQLMASNVVMLLIYIFIARMHTWFIFTNNKVQREGNTLIASLEPCFLKSVADWTESNCPKVK